MTATGVDDRPRWRVLALAAVAGLLLAAALPPWGWWPLAFGGVAALDALIAGRPAWSRFRRGFLAGVALLIPTYSWMAAFTPPGYVLAVLFYSAMLGAALVLVPASTSWRWVALPGALALWDGTRGRWPFGGVPISTLALGQVGSPLVGIARVGGPLLLGFATACAGVALAAVVRAVLVRARDSKPAASESQAADRHRWLRKRDAGPGDSASIVPRDATASWWLPAATATAALVALLVLGVAAPRAHDVGPLRVGLVQGGGDQGTTADEVSAAVVFQRHLETSQLLAPGLDVVLWPEDVVEVDGPFPASFQGSEVASEARRLNAVLMLGAVEDVSPTSFRNVQVAYGADGAPIARYEKVRRVPFGEFTPLRGFLEAVAGGTVRKSDAIPGHDPAVLRTPAGVFGVSTSWEIFFADRARAAIADGGEVLLNPTNGASFHGQIVQSQQLACTRLRAIETDRWALQAAPTGYSAIVSPSGTVEQRTAIGEQKVLTGPVQRRAGQTWAVRFGDWPALALSALGLAVAWAAAASRTRRNSGDSLGVVASSSTDLPNSTQ
ncbi:MAG: apolipoprotein N-acyltransferase [Acidimicrobiales bacterium]